MEEKHLELKNKIDELVKKFKKEEHKELFNFENNNYNTFFELEGYVIERVNMLLNIYGEFVQIDVFAGTYGNKSLPQNFKGLEKIYNTTKNVLSMHEIEKTEEENANNSECDKMDDFDTGINLDSDWSYQS